MPGSEGFCPLGTLKIPEVRTWFPRSEELVCPVGGCNDANVEHVSRHDRDRHGSTARRLYRMQEGQYRRQTGGRRTSPGIDKRHPTTGERRANARNNVPLGVKPSHLAADDLIGVDVIGMGVEGRSNGQELYRCSMN